MTAEAADFSTDFAAEFRADESAWRKAAEAALKGRPLDPLLRPKLVDGLAFDAIAKRTAAKPIAGRPAGERWTAMTRIDLASSEAANAQALEDLNNGASGLSLALAQANGRHGLVADTLERLDRALQGVMLDLAPIHVEVPHFEGRTTAALFAALVEKRGHAPGEVAILFGLDLMRDLTQTGTLTLPWDEMGRRSSATLTALLDRGFAAPILMMDQRIAHDAGASEAQELASALSSAVEHIRVMTANGLDAERVADTMSFAFACDADQFATIAKLRAARLLWAAVRREMGLPERTIHIHAQTSRRMMTRKDAQTNIVRTTVAAFAAGVGGANSVTVLPHSFALGATDADARRIARNAQAIVLEESNAYRVTDPAAGAGAIEGLTDALASRAWNLFREIEGQGGMFAALTSGVWQERIKETRLARAKGVASRKAAIVGVSEFPKADDVAPAPVSAERPDAAPRSVAIEPLDESAASFGAIVAAFVAGASTADVAAAWRPNPTASATPLELKRLAEPFERLRAENEAAGSQPFVFLALLGPMARHAARAGFVRNLMVAGGIAAVDGPVSESADEIAEAFGASGAKLAVVCATDADYTLSGGTLVEALKSRGATVWIAGRPKDAQPVLEQAGAMRFVAAGDDAIEILTEATAIATGHKANGGAA